MCGICGTLSFDGTPPDVGVVRRMAESLAHRGPDGEGFHGDALIALGHRRLSIIDLVTGDQPIFNEDGSVAIVFNGEIYNYRELRQDLLARGHRFKTSGDTEVIVHLYEERGPDCVLELNGMFAFALWDARRERLLLARDPLGEKPLYYASVGHRLFFASELKALLHVPGMRCELDPAALDDYLAYGYVPAPRTIYAGVSKLPAAHRLVVERGVTDLCRYWHPWSTTRILMEEEEAVRHLSTLLTDAIGLRLRSDVPVGAFLSGGIDSSLIVALAARQSASLQTFSVRMGPLGFDESPYARLVAERFGTDHHEIEVDVARLDDLPRLVRQFDEPFADPSAVPTYYITEAASRHVKVCLSGDGGDEVFAGYSQYRAEMLETLADRLPIPSRVFDGLAHTLPRRLPGVGFLSRLALRGADRHHAMVGLYSARERRMLLQPPFREAVDEGPWALADAHDRRDLNEVERRMLADQLSYLPDDILVKVDRDAMAHGLEVRVPFLDPRIVQFVNGLPLGLKVMGRTQKRLLRRLLADAGLPELLSRPKHGFGLPLKTWLRGRLGRDVENVLLAPDARIATLLDMRQVRRVVAASQGPGRDVSGQLWALFWLEHWLQACTS